MKNKFKFLTKDSIKKKVCTKSFKIINLILLIIIVGLINLDSIVKLFGGDFEDKINVYVIDKKSGNLITNNELLNEYNLNNDQILEFIAKIAKTIEATPRKPAIEVSKICLKDDLKIVRIKKTATGRAMSVKNKKIKLPDLKIFIIPSHEASKPRAKNIPICVNLLIPSKNIVKALWFCILEFPKIIPNMYSARNGFALMLSEKT